MSTTNLAATTRTDLAPLRSARVPRLLAAIELVKPRIMMMALVTAAGGYSLAPGPAAQGPWVWMLLGTALIVGSANALNMYLERETDCKMVRTQRRPLPEKRLAPATALWFGIALALAALPTLWLGSNLLTAILGAVAFVSYVGIYTPLKPRTHLATWIGAIPGAMPALMGYTAACGGIDAGGLAVFALLFFWQIPHFHAIGFYRMHEYQAAGLKTLANVRGAAAARAEIAVYLVVQVAASLAISVLGVASGLYTWVAILAGLAVLWQGLPGALSEERGDAVWARKLFVLSILYLPVVFFALVLGGNQ